MMAALLRRGPARWRSTQLALTLSCPPTNHLACGSFHSSTFCQGFAQVRLLACKAQKPSGPSFAAWKSRSYSARLLTWAAAANSAGGAKLRVSLRTLVMCEAEGEDMAENPSWGEPGKPLDFD